MPYILGGLSIFIAIDLVTGILTLLRRPAAPDGQQVILPKAVPVIGIVCSGAFLIPAVVLLAQRESPGLCLLFILFALLGASLVAAYKNCRIIYDETSFTAGDFWGRKRTYAYHEITSMQGGSMDVKLYVGRKVIRIDELAVGKREFLAHARKQYRKRNDGKPIPAAKAKTDIFKGNVNNPGEFIFVFALITAFLLGFFVLIAVTSLPASAEDLQYETLSFARYEIRDDTFLDLYSGKDSTPYTVPADILTDADEFIAACDAGETFEVCYVVYNDTDTPRKTLEYITDSDGTVYLTRNAVHEYNKRAARAFYWFGGGIMLIWLVFVGLSIYVGRNPQKFSRRIIRLFFKDGYVRYSPTSGGSNRNHA